MRCKICRNEELIPSLFNYVWFKDEKGRLIDRLKDQRAELHFICEKCVYGELQQNVIIRSSIEAEEILKKVGNHE